MTSEGLELHQDTFGTKDSMPVVKFGQLIGAFISYESKTNRIVFKVNSIVKAINFLESRLETSCSIELEEELYQITWNKYNYTVALHNGAIYATVEEQIHEKE